MSNDKSALPAAALPDAVVLTDQFHIDGDGRSPTVRDGSAQTRTPGVTRIFRVGDVVTDPADIAELLAHKAPIELYRRVSSGA